MDRNCIILLLDGVIHGRGWDWLSRELRGVDCDVIRFVRMSLKRLLRGIGNWRMMSQITILAKRRKELCTL